MSFIVEGLVRFPSGREDDVDRFCAEFEDVELSVVVDSGLGLAGAWKLASDTGTELLQLYGPIDGLADLTAAAQKIAQLPSDHPYLRLYSWISGAEIRYSRTLRPLIDPVDRSWWERRTEEPAIEPYFVATCRYGITGERTVRGPLTLALCATDAEVGVEVALAYDTLFGEYGTTRVIGTAATLDRFASALDRYTADSAADRDPWEVVAAVPLPYSPLR